VVNRGLRGVGSKFRLPSMNDGIAGQLIGQVMGRRKPG